MLRILTPRGARRFDLPACVAKARTTMRFSACGLRGVGADKHSLACPEVTRTAKRYCAQGRR